MTGCVSLSNGRSVHHFLLVGSIAAVVTLGGCTNRSANPHAEVEYFDFSAAHAVAARLSHTENIDFGTLDGRKFLLSGWSVDELWGGEASFVWGIGESSELWLDRLSRGDLRLRFRCQPLAGSRGPVTRAIRVEVNGVNISEVELQPGGFRSYEVLVPAKSLSAGQNRIVFQYDSTPTEGSRPYGEKRDLRVAWDWLKVDSNESKGASMAADGTADDFLMLPLNTRTDFFVELRPNSRIEWTAIRAWSAASTSTIDLHIEVEPDDGRKKSFAIRTPGLQGQGAGSQTLPFTRGFCRISFLAVRSSGDEDPDGAQGIELHGPRLLGPSEPYDETSSPQETIGQPLPPLTGQRNRPNVIVYLIDALRADHLGTYGYLKSISPNIDAFAADAVVFEQAFAQSSWTKTSVATILTGLLPRSHGTFEIEDILPPIRSYLPQLLRDAGFRTLAVSASAVISPEFGFDRGFEEFHLIEPTGGRDPVFAYSDVVTDYFVDWVTQGSNADEPFFAYLHTLDPHDPYGPPDLDRNPPPDRGSELWEFRRGVEAKVNAFLATHPELTNLDVRDHFLQLYDEDISFNDRQFDRLIQTLKDLDIYDSTIIVLLSDHGEEFFDHGGWGHGSTLRIEQLHIPLLLKLPDQLGGGRRVSSVAQHIDVVPTILVSLGMEVHSDVEGKSLLSDIRRLSECESDPTGPTEVLSNLSLYGIEIDSLLWDQLHLTRWNPDQPNERMKLYDLNSDHAELHDLAARRPAAVGFLRALLRAAALNPADAYQPEKLRLDGDAEDRLRALGYIE